ncbi:MAG: hypothetical protein HeimC3_52440 [Candidatus Heimdallarchaeota archaeon LC_3]|nr:MAG: hypothetical protein HeimC3_52440 [Candidatus Heimdallarchaeota archaeon LC_3]
MSLKKVFSTVSHQPNSYFFMENEYATNIGDQTLFSCKNKYDNYSRQLLNWDILFYETIQFINEPVKGEELPLFTDPSKSLAIASKVHIIIGSLKQPLKPEEIFLDFLILYFITTITLTPIITTIREEIFYQ